MEISTKTIVIMLVCIMLLVAVASFFIFQTSASMTKAEAEKLFQEDCLAYAKSDCSWSVTEQPGFQKFVDACKLLYGQERESLSCLYSFCGSCKSFNFQNVECEARCRLVNGLKSSGNSVTDACSSYSQKCPTIACGGCA